MPAPLKKSQYASRRIYVSVCRYGEGPAKVTAIASQQIILLSFFLIILNQFKKCCLVQSKLQFEGGYYFLSPLRNISAGEVLRCIHSTIHQNPYLACVAKKGCPFDQDDAFASFWERVQQSANKTYNDTTIEDPLDS